MKTSKSNNVRGFTFLEMMIAGALSVIILGAVMGTFSATNRAFSAVSNYGLIHKGGRTTVDFLAKDFRKATDITNWATTSVTLEVPTGYTSQGVNSGTMSVRYRQVGTSLIRENLTSGGSRTLATNVSTLTFIMYNRLGNAVSVTNLSKGLQVDVKLSKSVMGVVQTEDFLSARLVMRNKQ